MEKKQNAYVQLAMAMLRTGILGYGGGPSVMPLFRYEAVTRYKWTDDEEFGEILAIANALPGPIATKMAAYLGYKLKKTSGAVVAVLFHIFPSSIAMIALLSLVTVLSHSKVVIGMIAGVMPVVAVMLGEMAYNFGEKTVKGLGTVFGIAMFAVSFLLLETVHIHPAIVIMIFLAYGSVHFRLAGKRENREKERDVAG
ncbi:chromate transporter [Heyndrickxia coagulans]|uniref:Transporter YwrB n=1 Tax=Weizmannia acidilactici TaxID=2607726 RepID=A0A5J4JJ04_9BACI|nr:MULTISPECIES: chromate transporter [Heyndrickxia]MED4406791.1 chromate transporter [Heyndrickxia coagulans]MED4963638.1 chromate transporter [Heyndrickxia coagulans]MED4966488.1 chromate transporter [Heyndrickxia coagulans]GER67990.1 putative transporter YwrB [Weizmannia acidilactici]GER71731.1 putative transporter YwrB [Weizmannia acidilactici]